MNTCCFTGHRQIDKDDLPELRARLTEKIEELIGQGVTSFGCGGAIGFDMLAGFVTLDLKAKYPAVKLIMVLPCREQDAKWSAREKARYQQLLAGADKIVYVSERYYDGCMKARNAHLVENSDHLITYLKRERSGAAQTVRMAKERGLTIHNLA